MADLWGVTSKGERVNITQERAKRDRQQAKRDLINADKVREKEFPITFSLISRICGIVLLLLLVIGLYRVSQGYSIPLFSDLLDILANSPTVQIPMYGTLFADWVSSANLGIFSFLSYIAGAFGVVIDLAIFIANGMLSIYQYLFYFIRWIFVV